MSKACDPERMQRHKAIENSIGSLRNVRRELQDLFDEIVGVPREKPLDSPKVSSVEYQSLAFVLDNTFNYIHDECDTISGLIREIRTVIF